MQSRSMQGGSQQGLTLRRLSWIFTRIGNLTFGGGDPTMAALNIELVKQRRWLAAEDYGLIFALARITPGTNILAFCAGVGWRLLGWPAAVLAVLGATVPSAVVALLITEGFTRVQSNGPAMMALGAMMAAAVGMMGSGAYQLVQPHLRSGRWVRATVILSASVLLSGRFAVSPIPVLGLAALAGVFWRLPEQ